MGGALGARLLDALGIAVSGDTLRRAVGAAALPDTATPRVLGVDDWSLSSTLALCGLRQISDEVAGGAGLPLVALHG